MRSSLHLAHSFRRSSAVRALRDVRRARAKNVAEPRDSIDANEG